MALAIGTGGSWGGTIPARTTRRRIGGTYVPGVAPSAPTPGTGSPMASGGGSDIGTTLDDYLARARAQIDPLMQQVADTINRRGAMASGAISSAGQTLQNLVGSASGEVGAAFGPEISKGRAVANWANTSLTQAGGARQGELNAALAQSGFAPSAGPRDVPLAAQGRGAGAAAYGIGQADVDALVAKQAASAGRAAMEPTFAAGLSSMDQGLLAMQLSRQMAEQQSALQAQIPGIIDTLQQRDLAAAQDQRDYEFRVQQAELARQQDERDYQERVREYNAGVAADKAKTAAGIVGPKAPTLAGRIAYYQGQAKDMTASDPHGYVYYANPKGIGVSIRRDPATGRPIVDPAFTVAQQKGLLDTAKTKAEIANTRARTTAAVNKVYGSAKTGYWVFNSATGTKENVIPAAPNAPAKPVANQKIVRPDGSVWSFNPRTNTITKIGQTAASKKAGAAKMGTAPRRTGPGTWRTRGGELLNEAQKHYWEGLYIEGYIDRNGRLKKAIPPAWAPRASYKGYVAGGGSSGGLGDTNMTPSG